LDCEYGDGSAGAISPIAYGRDEPSEQLDIADILLLLPAGVGQHEPARLLIGLGYAQTSRPFDNGQRQQRLDRNTQTGESRFQR